MNEIDRLKAAYLAANRKKKTARARPKRISPAFIRAVQQAAQQQ